MADSELMLVLAAQAWQITSLIAVADRGRGGDESLARKVAATFVAFVVAGRAGEVRHAAAVE